VISLAYLFSPLFKHLRQTGNSRRPECIFYLISHKVLVLLSKAHDGIFNVLGRVADEEESGGQVEVGGGKGRMLLVLVPELGDEGRVIRRCD
jgi:hypothetical protein